jgi:protein-L-isoaspartate(D-aspartate) O-methyltransferase
MLNDEDARILAQRMVTSQIESRGIRDPRLLKAMGTILRHKFVSGKNPEDCYGDFPVSIGHGQTISQPYIVAFMTDLLNLKGYENVLEIGTGSGYQTALLALLAESVTSIERIPELSARAGRTLAELGYKNVTLAVQDGTLGFEKNAPYDRIIVTAAAPHLPVILKNQLADNGILVVPVGDVSTYQELQIVMRMGNSYSTRKSIGCRFVPLIGQDAYSE